MVLLVTVKKKKKKEEGGGEKAVCSVINGLLIFRASLSTAKKRRGIPVQGFPFSAWNQHKWCVVFYILWYNLYTTSFACKFHAIFSPSPDPPKPQPLCPLWQSPKNTKTKEGYCKKSDLGWSFSQRNIKTLQKRRMEKRHSLCVMEETKSQKNQVSLAGTSQTNPCESGTDDSDISSNSNPSALRRSNQQPIATARSTSSPTHPEPNQVITHVEPSGAHTLHISIFRASARARGVGDAVVAVEAGW